MQFLKRENVVELCNKLIDDSFEPCSEFCDSHPKQCSDENNIIVESDVICKHPLVSVRVITWRHERYIRECLESICTQKTDFEYEVLVGEDASPDSTREICLELQRKYPTKIRVIYSSSNVGPSKNARRAMDLARGDYIAICEGDDFWVDPLKLQIQADVLRRKSDVAIVHTGTFMQYECMRFTRYPISSSTRSLLQSFNDKPKSQQQKAFLQKNWIATGTVMYRRSVVSVSRRLRAALFAKTKWIPSGDFVVWHAAMSVGRLYYVDRLMGVRRINAGSLTAIPDPRKSQARIIGDCRNRLWLSLGIDEQLSMSVFEDLCRQVERFELISKSNRPLGSRMRMIPGLKPLEFLVKRIIRMIVP